MYIISIIIVVLIFIGFQIWKSNRYKEAELANERYKINLELVKIKYPNLFQEHHDRLWGYYNYIVRVSLEGDPEKADWEYIYNDLKWDYDYKITGESNFAEYQKSPKKKVVDMLDAIRSASRGLSNKLLSEKTLTESEIQFVLYTAWKEVDLKDLNEIASEVKSIFGLAPCHVINYYLRGFNEDAAKNFEEKVVFAYKKIYNLS